MNARVQSKDQKEKTRHLKDGHRPSHEGAFAALLRALSLSFTALGIAAVDLSNQIVEHLQGQHAPML